jgi:hypothetical protein
MRAVTKRGNIIRLTFDDVWYSESVGPSLLSLGKLQQEDGWQFYTEDSKKAFLKHESGTELPLYTKNKVYELQAITGSVAFSTENSGGVAYNTVAVTATQLGILHARCGHMGVDELLRVLKQQHTTDLPSLSEEELTDAAQQVVRRCASCLQGKGTREPFGHEGMPRASRPFEKVHADTIQMASVKTKQVLTSVEGYTGAVTLVDDYSGLIWMIPIVSKAEVADRIIAWHRAIETKTGYKMVEFHSDNGSEFINSKLKEHFSKTGTAMTQSPVGTPQLNGKAERANRTVPNGARTVLFAANLPKKLWAKAIGSVLHARNRTHLDATTGITPYEAFFGRKPSLETVRVFGCDAAYHVPPQHRDKLGARTRTGVYVGYDEARHAKMVYDPELGKTVVSRDVTLYEDRFTHGAQLSGERHEADMSLDVVSSIVEPEQRQTASTAEESSSKQSDGSQHASQSHSTSSGGVSAERATGRIKMMRDMGPFISHYATVEDEEEQKDGDAVPLVIYFTAIGEGKPPRTFTQAMQQPDSQQWLEAIVTKLDTCSTEHDRRLASTTT